MTDSERLKAVIEYVGINPRAFSISIGKEKADMIYNILNQKIGSNGKTVKISKNIATLIRNKYPEISEAWLLTGEGGMLKSSHNDIKDGNLEIKDRSSKLIPFYDDVSTIGGKNEQIADIHGTLNPTEYIDTGDWFKDATAAIRHYGDSMTEYPNGCIIALKEVYDRELVIPGRDYVIETSEYRVTKRLQNGKTNDYIHAYSTNEETYKDGRLIHEPFEIPWKAINRISLILGYVVKKNGGTIMFSNQNK